MFNSLPALEGKAIRLLRAYEDWANSTAASFVDNRLGRRPAIGDLTDVRGTLQGFVEAANAISVDAEFTALSAEMQADVTAILDEGRIATEEFDDITDPDEVYETAEGYQRRNFASSVRVPLDVADLIKGRLTHEIRKSRPAGAPAERAYVRKTPKRVNPVIEDPGTPK